MFLKHGNGRVGSQTPARQLLEALRPLQWHPASSPAFVVSTESTDLLTECLLLGIYIVSAIFGPSEIPGQRFAIT